MCQTLFKYFKYCFKPSVNSYPLKYCLMLNIARFKLCTFSHACYSF